MRISTFLLVIFFVSLSIIVHCFLKLQAVPVTTSLKIAGGASDITGVGAGGETSGGLRSLESLDKVELGCLLSNTDFSGFKDSFIAAGVTGYVLQDLESNEELKELGITMPGLIFKALLRRVAEVCRCLSVCL